MQRRQIGVVGALWRYPVKSMRGEQIPVASVTPYGLAGDRGWALRETQYGGIVSARTWPAMLQLRASLTDALAPVRIEMPDGTMLHDADPAASRPLSDSARGRAAAEPLTPAEREAIMRGEAMPPARDFFDEEVIHLIATGTLA